jgi:hypothetical protein
VQYQANIFLPSDHQRMQEQDQEQDEMMMMPPLCKQKKFFELL